MKRLLLLFTMLLCLHTAIAQQFKTSQGITTVTVVKPKSEPKAPKTKKEKSQKIEQSSGIVITAVLKSSGIIGNAYYTIGYKFNENIVAGGGVGLGGYDYDDYDTCHSGGFIIPIYLNGRYYLGKNKFRPFLNLSIGTDVFLETHREATKRSSYGLLDINPSIGVCYKLNNKLDFFISAGYRYFDYDCHGLSFNIGLSF